VKREGLKNADPAAPLPAAPLPTPQLPEVPTTPYLTQVDVITIDGLVEAWSLDVIDFLSIDTEGFDALAILGMVRTLAAGRVRLLEFEYHSVGEGIWWGEWALFFSH
jgi:FkbM family methyltransferase